VKKALKVFMIILGLFVLMNVFMFAFKICPPKGPWPMPPWCKNTEQSSGQMTDIPGMAKISEVLDQNGISAPKMEMVQRSMSEFEVEPYQPRDLSYISKTFKKTGKELKFIAGMFDIWGNPYSPPEGMGIPQKLRENWFDLGEDPRKHDNIPASMQRLQDIGSEMVMITDFAEVQQDLMMKFQDDKVDSCQTITQEELKKFVITAKEHNQQVIYITNLMDEKFQKERIKAYIQGSNLYDKNPEEACSFDRFNMSKEVFSELHDEWKKIMIEQAEKAETAGVDYMVINARDASWYSQEYSGYENQRYKEMIAELRKCYSGKLGVNMPLEELGPDKTFVQQLDFIIFREQIEKILGDASTDDVDSIVREWTEYLKCPGLKRLADKELFLEVLMPSYEGAMKKGWIEPGGHYPDLEKDFKEQALVYEALFRALYNQDKPVINGVMSYGYWWTNYIYPDIHELRTDLCHSIRNKDAEHVFHKWSDIFE